MQFTKGDILEFNPANDWQYNAKRGARAIFQCYTQTSQGDELISVIWVRNKKSGEQHDGGYYETDFEKVPTKVKKVAKRLGSH